MVHELQDDVMVSYALLWCILRGLPWLGVYVALRMNLRKSVIRQWIEV